MADKLRKILSYDRIGLNERTEVYAAIAGEVCAYMTAALQVTAKKGVHYKNKHRPDIKMSARR